MSGPLGAQGTPSSPAGFLTPLWQLASTNPSGKPIPHGNRAVLPRDQNGLGLLQLSPPDCKQTAGAALGLEKTKTMQLPASLHPHRVEAALPLTGLGLAYKNLGMK